MSKRWYVVHVYSGMEKSVHKALNERIERAGLQTSFGRILVPSEEVVEVKGGQKSITERRIFPGYVLVEMDLTDETWHLVKNTNRVTGFLGGSGNRPTPISEKEVERSSPRWKRASRNRVPRSSSRWARWFGSRKVRLRTSTATSKKSTTKRARCACRSPFWSRHARRTRFQPGRKDLTSTPGASVRLVRGDITRKEHKHGEEDRRLYQAASAGW